MAGSLINELDVISYFAGFFHRLYSEQIYENPMTYLEKTDYEQIAKDMSRDPNFCVVRSYMEKMEGKKFMDVPTSKFTEAIQGRWGPLFSRRSRYNETKLERILDKTAKAVHASVDDTTPDFSSYADAYERLKAKVEWDIAHPSTCDPTPVEVLIAALGVVTAMGLKYTKTGEIYL